jgi:1-deoxy-D-xylulose-5-phosphate reductoisomerase
MALAEPRNARAPRLVSVLGSTGSVGCNTLDLIERNPEAFQVVALTANRNVDALVAQALKFRPKVVAIADPECYRPLKNALSNTGIEVAAGTQSLVDAAARPADWVMAAIVGAAGLAPTIAAAQQGAILAVANKECFVTAGDLFLTEVTRHGATVLPVDSEHNAIFQVFDFNGRDAIERIILTASGGPFRETPLNELSDVTPSQATAHPNWDMGAKISIDSATMMNKGLELIEAHYLFDMPAENIEVLVHPQSIVHSMVGYVDGSVLAQLGTPDMRTPIAYTLAWPERMAAPSGRLDLAEIATLNFEAPDLARFPALGVARAALAEGNGAPTILNAANEVAVAAFMEGQLGFLDIVPVVERTLETMTGRVPASLPDVVAIDEEARRAAAKNVAQRGGA